MTPAHHVQLGPITTVKYHTASMIHQLGICKDVYPVQMVHMYHLILLLLMDAFNVVQGLISHILEAVVVLTAQKGHFSLTLVWINANYVPKVVIVIMLRR